MRGLGWTGGRAVPAPLQLGAWWADSQVPLPPWRFCQASSLARPGPRTYARVSGPPLPISPPPSQLPCAGVGSDRTAVHAAWAAGGGVAGEHGLSERGAMWGPLCQPTGPQVGRQHCLPGGAPDQPPSTNDSSYGATRPKAKAKAKRSYKAIAFCQVGSVGCPCLARRAPAPQAELRVRSCVQAARSGRRAGRLWGFERKKSRQGAPARSALGTRWPHAPCMHALLPHHTTQKAALR